MDRIAQNRYGWTVLLLLGATSATLSANAPKLAGFLQFFWVGGVFGAALSGYFAFCKGYRNLRSAALFIAISMLTYYVSVLGSLLLTLHSPPSLVYGLGSDQVDYSIVAVGGLIGGLLLVAAAVRCFRISKSRMLPDLGKASIGALLGGFLGVVGWLLGPSLGKALWTALPDYPLPSPDSFNSYSLYFVWQIGMALFIALAVSWQEKASASASAAVTPSLAIPVANRTAITRKTLIVTAAIALTILAARVVPVRRAVARRQNAAARKAAELPSRVGLPHVQPMPIEKVLILQDVAGFKAVQPRLMPIGESNEKGYSFPGSFRYGVEYCATEKYFLPGSVSVSVQQYPNVAWAVYLAKYPLNIVNLFNDPKNPALITKFQNKIWSNVFRIGPAVPLYYIWASGNDVVTITYNSPNENNDEFLKVYLQRYPSVTK